MCPVISFFIDDDLWEEFQKLSQELGFDRPEDLVTIAIRFFIAYCEEKKTKGEECI